MPRARHAVESLENTPTKEAGMAIEAHCGTLSALTLALPRSCAVPESRGTLPKGMFVAKVAVSAKTKQHLIHAIDGITMLAILRAANTGVEQGRRIRCRRACGRFRGHGFRR